MRVGSRNRRAGGSGCHLKGTVSVWVHETAGGEGCPTLRLYLMPLNRTLKKRVKWQILLVDFTTTSLKRQRPPVKAARETEASLGQQVVGGCRGGGGDTDRAHGPLPSFALERGGPALFVPALSISGRIHRKIEHLTTCVRGAGAALRIWEPRNPPAAPCASERGALQTPVRISAIAFRANAMGLSEIQTQGPSDAPSGGGRGGARRLGDKRRAPRAPGQRSPHVRAHYRPAPARGA